MLIVSMDKPVVFSQNIKTRMLFNLDPNAFKHQSLKQEQATKNGKANCDRAKRR